MAAAKAYVKEYTGLTADELDDLPDATIAVLVLVQDMYDNRSRYVDGRYANQTVETILGMYRRNLL